MQALQFLRQSKLIARLVLVWFALSVTAAVAAPVLNPQNLTLVCTAAGQVKLVNANSSEHVVAATDAKGATDTQGVAVGLHQHLDCVLCLSLQAFVAADVQLPPALMSEALKPVLVPDAVVPHLHASNISARGPPASSGFALSL
jgi:hypothetical protein